MKHHVFSVKSPMKQECEDAYFINSSVGVFGVLDGVTPLHDFKDEHGHNSGFLAANLFKDYFEQLKSLESLPTEIVKANRLLKNKMVEYQVDLSVKHELWSTCIAVAHVHDGSVSYAQLGDCMVLARCTDGTVQVLTKDFVRGTASRARERRRKDRANGIDVPDESFFEIPRNRWMYQRWMANSPDGYGVANGMDEMKVYIQSGTLPVFKVTHLLMISDGMFFLDRSLESTFQDILQMGFDAYVEQLVQEEQARGLKPDDRTAILLQF